jgi:hypothetical protein
MKVGAPDILVCLGPALEKPLRDPLGKNLPRLAKTTLLLD